MSEEWVPWGKRPENRERHLELRRGYNKKYKPKDKERYLELKRMEKNKRYERNKAIIVRPQRCEVCSREGDTLSDHCHHTNKFRGFICMWCNSALGFAKDNPETLRKLAEYLEQRRED